jgi:hypothetical protein
VSQLAVRLRFDPRHKRTASETLRRRLGLIGLGKQSVAKARPTLDYGLSARCRHLRHARRSRQRSPVERPCFVHVRPGWGCMDAGMTDPLRRRPGQWRGRSVDELLDMTIQTGDAWRLIAVGLATALCRRILFVTPSPSGSWNFAAATTRLSSKTERPDP